MPVFTKKPSRAKLIAAIMARDEQLIADALRALESSYGKVESSSRAFPFKYSDYYKREMGDSLLKMFCSFAMLIEPDEIVDLKLKAVEVEKQFPAEMPHSVATPHPASGSPTGVATRTVNIDPGYLDRMKLVLATTKDCPHRIYLGRGIYGDLELIYRSGSFASLDWSYLDYREPFTIEFFNTVRNRYLAELRDERRKNGTA